MSAFQAGIVQGRGEAEQEIAELRAEVARLEAENERLRARVARLAADLLTAETPAEMR